MPSALTHALRELTFFVLEWTQYDSLLFSSARRPNLAAENVNEMKEVESVQVYGDLS
jgi:hypothetical protein